MVLHTQQPQMSLPQQIISMTTCSGWSKSMVMEENKLHTLSLVGPSFLVDPLFSFLRLTRFWCTSYEAVVITHYWPNLASCLSTLGTLRSRLLDCKDVNVRVLAWDRWCQWLENCLQRLSWAWVVLYTTGSAILSSTRESWVHCKEVNWADISSQWKLLAAFIPCQPGLKLGGFSLLSCKSLLYLVWLKDGMKDRIAPTYLYRGTNNSFFMSKRFFSLCHSLMNLIEQAMARCIAKSSPLS